jgi:PAS domain S-box-containing protein
VTHASSHTPQDPTALDRDALILALQARERFLDAILGSLEIFVAVDKDWLITFANRAAGDGAHMSPDSLAGSDVREFLPAESREAAEAALARAMTGRVSVEFQVVTQPRTYQGAAHPLSDGGLAVYLRDVTEA